MMSQNATRQRVPLHKLVNSLVDKWSLDYVDRAKSGDFESMLTVATAQYSKSGWGKISHNPYQGRRWVEFAASKGDPYAIFTLKNLIMADEHRTDQLAQLRRYAIVHFEHPRQWMKLWEHSEIYHKGWNPRRLMGAGGQDVDPNSVSTLKVYDNTDPDMNEKIANGTYNESIRYKNARPLAPYRYPAVYSKNELFRTVKSTLDGKMQHRVTDPLPRPVGEYIHSNLPSMGIHTPLIDYVAGFAENPNLQIVGPEQSFKDHSLLFDDEGTPLKGEAADVMADAMDRLDRYNIKTSPTAADAVCDTWANFYETAGFVQVDDIAKETEEREAAHAQTLIDEATERPATPLFHLPTYTTEAESVVIKDKQQRLKLYMREWKKFYSQEVDIDRSLNGVPELVDEFFITDGPWENRHMTWNDFSDVEHIMSNQEEADQLDGDRTINTAIGLHYNTAHRYPYMGSPTRNHFEGDPDKVYMHNEYGSQMMPATTPGWMTLDAMQSRRPMELLPAPLRRLVRLKRVLDFNIPLGMVPILEHVNEDRVYQTVYHAMRVQSRDNDLDDPANDDSSALVFESMPDPDQMTEEDMALIRQEVTAKDDGYGTFKRMLQGHEAISRGFVPIMESEHDWAVGDIKPDNEDAGMSCVDEDGEPQPSDISVSTPDTDNFADMFRSIDCKDFWQHLTEHVDENASKLANFHDVSQMTLNYYKDVQSTAKNDMKRSIPEKEGRILYPNYDFIHAIRTRGDLVRFFNAMKSANPSLYATVRQHARDTELPLDEETTLYTSLRREVNELIGDEVAGAATDVNAKKYSHDHRDDFINFGKN